MNIGRVPFASGGWGWAVLIAIGCSIAACTSPSPAPDAAPCSGSQPLDDCFPQYDDGVCNGFAPTQAICVLGAWRCPAGTVPGPCCPDGGMADASCPLRTGPTGDQ